MPPLLWECRYFVQSLPMAFEAATATFRFTGEGATQRDDDVYLFSPDSTANIKLRRRLRTLKLKALVAAPTGDGFERWDTVLEVVLPASPEIWHHIGDILGVGPFADLSVLSDIDVIVGVLARRYPDIRRVSVQKDRTLYRTAAARLEIARIVAADRPCVSVQFESEKLADGRELRSHLSGESLGTPTNYVNVCRALVEGGTSLFVE